MKTKTQKQMHIIFYQNGGYSTRKKSSQASTYEEYMCKKRNSYIQCEHIEKQKCKVKNTVDTSH